MNRRRNSVDAYEDRILPEVAERIRKLQRRCVNCGNTYSLHIHHRVFRSEGELGVVVLLAAMKELYEESYGKPLTVWRLHDIQNLIVLCQECHEGGQGVHGGNEKLRQTIRNSFTDEKTGFNVMFVKQNRLY